MRSPLSLTGFILLLLLPTAGLYSQFPAGDPAGMILNIQQAEEAEEVVEEDLPAIQGISGYAPTPSKASMSIIRSTSDGGKTEILVRQEWMDSTGQWVNSSKRVSTYDAMGFPEETNEYSWDGAQWVHAGKQVYVKDGEGRTSERIVWMTISGSLRYSDKYLYQYNSAGRRVEYIHQRWLGDDWLNYSRNVYRYTEQGAREEFISLRWNESEHRWDNRKRDIYQYYESGRRSEILRQIGSDTSWFNSSRTSYTYDSDTNLILSVRYTWAYADGWKPNSQNLSSYGAGGKEQNVVRQVWKDADSTWMNSEQISELYHPTGLRSGMIRQIWILGRWEYVSRTDYQYDHDNHLTGRTSKRWGNNGWLNADKSTYDYDADGGLTEALYVRWNENGWLAVSRQLYSTEVLTDIQELNLPHSVALFQNYPNPFNPATTIRYQLPGSAFVKLTVYNVLGEEVRVLVDEQQDGGRKAVMFNAVNLPTGLYYYRLKAGEYSSTKKLVLVK